MANYDQAVVTMLGDIAQNYVEIRTDQERIRPPAPERGRAAGRAELHPSPLPRSASRPTSWTWSRPRATWRRPRPKSCRWRSTSARPANRLCTLLGIPATDLQYLLGTGPDSHRAAGGGRGHSRRTAPPPSRRAAGRAAGGRPGRADRHRRGRTLSDHFHQRRDRLAGNELQGPLQQQRPGRHRRAAVPVEHPQLRPHPQQRPPAGRRC